MVLSNRLTIHLYNSFPPHSLTCGFHASSPFLSSPPALYCSPLPSDPAWPAQGILDGGDGSVRHFDVALGSVRLFDVALPSGTPFGGSTGGPPRDAAVEQQLAEGALRGAAGSWRESRRLAEG